MKKGLSPAAIGALLKGDMKNFEVAMKPGGIEEQERNGQIEHSFLDTLPKDLKPDPAVFGKLGFKFLGDHDDIFFKCEFPKGWRKKITEHSMWTELLDDKGRKRGMIFCKAAFYDRSAHAHLVCRYTSSNYHEVNETTLGTVIMDAGTVIHTIGTRAREAGWETVRAQQEEAVAWLKTSFPAFEDPVAYWD